MTENKHLCLLVAETLKPARHQANNLCSNHCALTEIPTRKVLSLILKKR